MSREWGVDPERKISDYMRATYPTVVETTFANLYLGLFDLSVTRRIDRPLFQGGVKRQ